MYCRVVPSPSQHRIARSSLMWAQFAGLHALIAGSLLVRESQAKPGPETVALPHDDSFTVFGHIPRIDHTLVLTWTSVDEVSRTPVVRSKYIESGRTGEMVAASHLARVSSPNDIGAVSASELISPESTGQRVVPSVPLNRVAPRAPAQRVVPSIAEHGVIACSCADGIVPCTGTDRVFPSGTVQVVTPPRAGRGAAHPGRNKSERVHISRRDRGDIREPWGDGHLSGLVVSPRNDRAIALEGQVVESTRGDRRHCRKSWRHVSFPATIASPGHDGPVRSEGKTVQRACGDGDDA